MDDSNYYHDYNDRDSDSVEDNRLFNDEPLKVSRLINEKIHEIKLARSFIQQYASRKSSSSAAYSRKIAVVTLQLKNNMIEHFEGEVIPRNPAVTLIKTIAEGICWQEELEKEEGENQYKGLICILDAIKAELNGLQSINKHLD